MVEIVIVETAMVETAMINKNHILILSSIFLFSGCALTNKFSYDTDKDGVANYKDICKVTPIGAKVDKYGCALDEDFDGVIDMYDKCPRTKASELVDGTGCTIKKI